MATSFRATTKPNLTKVANCPVVGGEREFQPGGLIAGSRGSRTRFSVRHPRITRPAFIFFIPAGMKFRQTSTPPATRRNDKTGREQVRPTSGLWPRSARRLFVRWWCIGSRRRVRQCLGEHSVCFRGFQETVFRYLITFDVILGIVSTRISVTLEFAANPVPTAARCMTIPDQRAILITRVFPAVQHIILVFRNAVPVSPYNLETAPKTFSIRASCLQRNASRRRRTKVLGCRSHAGVPSLFS